MRIQNFTLPNVFVTLLFLCLGHLSIAQPNAQCIPNTDINLSATGTVTIVPAFIDNGSQGVVSLSVSPTILDCTNLNIPTLITLTATDAGGLMSSCNTLLTPLDVTLPIAKCLPNFNVFLSALGQVQLFPFNINANSSDNCDQFLELILDKQFFNCSDVGVPQIVTMTAKDDTGNTHQCMTLVNVMDLVPPVVPCQNITVELTTVGTVSMTAADFETGGGFDDVCGIASVTLDMMTLNCMNIGFQQVTVVVTDNNGNSNNCKPFVTVEDNIAPMAVCQDVDVFLDGNGNGNITPADVDGGSTDNCFVGGLSLTGTTVFDCFHIGQNISVTLNVTDNSGNSASCNAMISVFDNIPPVLICQDITVQLDANGMANITSNDILITSADACGIANNFLDNDNFDCSNVGPNMVALSVFDIHGNPGTCTQNVMVQDLILPTMLCQNTAVVLDANGAASIIINDVNNGSFDNCAIASLSVNPSTFGCNHVGMSLAVLTGIDVNGNSASCNATVLVSDVTPPNAVCQNIDVFLNANGTVSTTPNDIDGGTSDACGIMDLFSNPINFDCDDIGPNSVFLTAVDPSGNSNHCIAIVNVIDDTPAVIGCRPTIHTVADLSICGKADLIMLPPLILNENCGITNISNNAPAVFPLGTTIVTWSILDAGNNISNCNQLVMIQDNNPPIIDCGNSFVAYTTADQCSYPSYLLQAPTVSDNCGVAAVSSDAPYTFSVGNYMVMWTATDYYGNESSCMQWVKIFDIIGPTITSCPDDILIEATETNGSAQAFFPFATATDNCGPIIYSTASHDSGDYFSLGDTEVTMTLYDSNGNISNCNFVVTVEPITPLQNLTVDCMPTLEVSIDSEIEIGTITWNSLMTQSNCLFCEVNTSDDLTHLGFFDNSNYYAYSAGKVTFSQANFLANFHGGKLVIIDEEKENLFLSNELKLERAYIGLIDNNGDGTLNWVDGNEFEVFDWQEESVEILDFPSAAILKEDGSWTMQSLNETAYFLFEIPCIELEISIEDENEETVEYAYPETTSVVNYFAEDECGNQDFCEFDILFTSDVVPYCGSEGMVLEEDAHRYIHKFSIGNFQMESGNNEGYGNFTNTPIELVVGETIEISTLFGPIELEDAVYCRMWIDLNGDGDFYDEDEMVMQGIDEFFIEGDLTIPFPTNDDLEETRMRLSIAKYAFPEPCGNIPNGEVEDYTIKFVQNIQGLVSVTLNGLHNGIGTQLHWLTNTTRKIDYYQIERSTAGQPYEIIGTTTDLTKISHSKTYGFLDNLPFSGVNSYRILVTLKSGETFYTNIIQTQFNINPNEVILMPNPADERIQLSMKKLVGKSAMIKIYNSLGYEVKQKTVAEITTAATNINLDDLTDGLYQLQIFVEGHRAITKSFVVDKLHGYRPASD